MKLVKFTQNANAKRVALAFILAPLLFACEGEVAEQESVVRPIKAIKVADASNFRQRWFSGRAKATQEVDLSFRVSGPLIARTVDVGTEVRKDDGVARIDPATFTADVERAQASLMRAEATLKNAEDQLRRKQVLVKQGHTPRAALDRQLAAEREAKADVADRRAALKRRQLDLGYTMLKAPFSGRVVATYVENFQDVRAKQPIIRLIDSSRIEMIVDIPESLISQAYAVQDVLVRFDALPGVDVSAQIKEIGTEASQATRTYPVTLVMDQPSNNQILPGMAGKATVRNTSTQEGQPTRIIVPETAVLTKGDTDKTYVWVIDASSKTVSSREVQTGEFVDQGLEIVGGLKPGEHIAIAGVNYLKEGQKVLLQE